MIKKENLPECPVATTVSLTGSKWKLLILRDLLTGTKRFGQLKKSLPDISQKVLTESLKSMRPVISVMEQWGKEYKERERKKNNERIK